ncbi:unnamed protein product [Alopecurus aequalis]
MAGLKPSANLFAFLDRNDPGDLNAAMSTATPATASLTQELFGHAYPSAREYIIRQNQLERQAWAEKRAADRAKREAVYTHSNGVSAKRAGYNNNNNNKNNTNNRASRRQHRPSAAVNKVPEQDVKAATLQAPPPLPPSIYDVNEFPSLK